MRRKSSSGVPCAENPVVECVRPYADTPNWDEKLARHSLTMKKKEKKEYSSLKSNDPTLVSLTHL